MSSGSFSLRTTSDELTAKFEAAFCLIKGTTREQEKQCTWLISTCYVQQDSWIGQAVRGVNADGNTRQPSIDSLVSCSMYLLTVCGSNEAVIDSEAGALGTEVWSEAQRNLGSQDPVFFCAERPTERQEPHWPLVHLQTVVQARGMVFNVQWENFQLNSLKWNRTMTVNDKKARGFFRYMEARSSRMRKLIFLCGFHCYFLSRMSCLINARNQHFLHLAQCSASTDNPRHSHMYLGLLDRLLCLNQPPKQSSDNRFCHFASAGLHLRINSEKCVQPQMILSIFWNSAFWSFIYSVLLVSVSGVLLR